MCNYCSLEGFGRLIYLALQLIFIAFISKETMGFDLELKEFMIRTNESTIWRQWSKKGKKSIESTPEALLQISFKLHSNFTFDYFVLSRISSSTILHLSQSRLAIPQQRNFLWEKEYVHLSINRITRGCFHSKREKEKKVENECGEFGHPRDQTGQGTISISLPISLPISNFRQISGPSGTLNELEFSQFPFFYKRCFPPVFRLRMFETSLSR